MTITTVVLVCLACYRGTLLVTSDRVTRTPRRWLRRHLTEGSRLAYLLECPWCVSAHIGILASVIVWVWPEGWWKWPALALAASGVAGLLATVAAPDDNDWED